jgi:hypothetical protein
MTTGLALRLTSNPILSLARRDGPTVALTEVAVEVAFGACSIV